MDNLKNFYDIKIKTIENIDNNIGVESNEIEQYLQNYCKLFNWYRLTDDEQAKECQKIILNNIKLLIESNKQKIKKKLDSDIYNLIEISNEYSDFIVFLFSLREKYPYFKDSIIIDDMV